MRKLTPNSKRHLIQDARYHRHVLGGGNTLKAVTRTRRAAAGRTLGHATGGLRAERRALLRLQAVVTQLEAQERESE